MKISVLSDDFDSNIYHVFTSPFPQYFSSFLFIIVRWKLLFIINPSSLFPSYNNLPDQIF